MNSSLNVSQEIYNKSVIKRLNSKVSGSNKITASLFAKIEAFLPYDVLAVDRKYNLQIVISAKTGVYAADESGRIFHMLDSSFCTEVMSHSARVTALLYDKVSDLLISTCETRQLRITKLGSFKWEYGGIELPEVVRCLAFNRCAGVVYAGDEDGCLSFFDITNRVCTLRLKINESPLRSLLFTERQARLYATGADGIVHVYDVETPLLLATLEHGGSIVTSIAAHNSLIYTATDNGTISIWSS